LFPKKQLSAISRKKWRTVPW